MSGPAKRWFMLAMISIAAAAGSLWWLVQEAAAPVPLERADSDVAPVFLEAARTTPPPPRVTPKPVAEEAMEAEEWPPGTVPGELVFTFTSTAEMEQFLREARRRGLAHFEIENVLRLIRLQRLSPEQARVAREIAGDALLSYNPFILSPDVPPLDDVAGGRFRPFGEGLAEWLGLPEDNFDWGRGVKIAVLDTGVASHPSLAHASITHLSLLSDEARAQGVGIHGTGVASLIAGWGEGIQGVAPSADLLSIQVLDANGVGDGFTLARGIIAAVEAGAKVINLSLGTNVHSLFLHNAVDYALNNGIAVVAAAGNNGDGQLLFPARYPGVVSVGGIDANNRHLPFSNRGEEMSLVAPSYGVVVGAGDEFLLLVNGTSFGAGPVTGTIAEQLAREPSLSPIQAAQRVVENADDIGPPGHEGYHGHGALNPGRAFRAGSPGIVDVAVADFSFNAQVWPPEVVVSVQNRGTAPAGGVFLEVRVNGVRQGFMLGRIEPRAVVHRSVPLRPFVERGIDQFEIEADVTVPGIAKDSKVIGFRLGQRPGS